MSHKEDSSLQTIKNALGIGKLNALHLMHHSRGTIFSCVEPKEMVIHVLNLMSANSFYLSDYIITDDKDLSIHALKEWLRVHIVEKGNQL